MNIAKVLKEFCVEEFESKTNAQVSAILGVTEGNFTNYINNSSAGEIVTKRMIKNFIIHYISSKKYTKLNLMNILSSIIEDKFEIESIPERGKFLGIQNANFYNYLNKNNFGETVAYNSIEKLISNYSEKITGSAINPIYELRKIKPRKYGQTFLIYDEETIQEEIKNALDGKKGIYAFYNSQAKLIYVGKTSNNFFTEISQQLGRDIEVYEENFQKKKIKQGTIVNYFSAYEVKEPKLISDIEALIIRLTYTENLNEKLENFSSVKRKHFA